ncbi:MAG: outer membrane lipid asymmetry maintenance protein MlaD [Alphaproteobacteria bacterium]|jgi:phospholipid/cholesterol/gamma-HCH transport system substrate-binding protein
MQNGFVETLIGAAVVAVAGVFFYYGWSTTGSGSVQGYELVAKFERIDGINVGTDVRLSGIKIGTVTAQELDAKSYRAVVKMNIKEGVPIPDDSSVKVASEGLLGGSYLAVMPGASESNMKSGGEFEITQGSVDLITLFVKSMSGGESNAADPAGPGGSADNAAPAMP